MDLPDMQAESIKRTQAVIGAWGERPKGQTKLIVDEYKNAYKLIDEKLKEIYTKFLSGVKPEDYYNEIIKYNRFANIQKQVREYYMTASKKAGLKQIELSKTAMSNVYYQNMYAVNWFSGINEFTYFTVLNNAAVEVSVLGTPEVWKQIAASKRALLQPYQPKHGTLTEVLLSNNQKDINKIKQTLTQSLIQGKSYTNTAKDLRTVMETSASNAVRIARTEGARNMNSGAFANTQAALDAGLELKRQAIETLDKRTREQSATIDDQIVDADKPFIYPGGLEVMIIGNSGVAAYDINERGTSIDVVPDTPQGGRTGRDPVTGENLTATFNNFDDWMKKHDLKFNKSGRIVSK
jgi:hypothetical protein